MTDHGESQMDKLAYARLKETIDQTYPKGWFVAVADHQVIGASERFQELERSLRAKGKDPRTVLVVEAGVAAPEYVTIFAQRISYAANLGRASQSLQGNGSSLLGSPAFHRRRWFFT
jgi:hypothetical protein